MQIGVTYSETAIPGNTSEIGCSAGCPKAAMKANAVSPPMRKIASRRRFRSKPMVCSALRFATTSGLSPFEKSRADAAQFSFVSWLKQRQRRACATCNSEQSVRLPFTTRQVGTRGNASTALVVGRSRCAKARVMAAGPADTNVSSASIVSTASKTSHHSHRRRLRMVDRDLSVPEPNLN